MRSHATTRPVPSPRRHPAALAAAAVLALAAAGAGCESGDGSSVSVSASPRDLSAVGQTSSLSLSGGKDGTWSLSDGSIGVLSRTTGDAVVYTAVKMPEAGGAYLNQVVTCVSAQGVAGSVTLRHISEGGTATADSTGAGDSGTSGASSSSAVLGVSPVSAAAEVGSSGDRSVSISVDSPSPGATYRWTVSPSIGRVSPATGSSTTYTAPTSSQYRGRTVTVTCRDSATSQSATCTISLE